MKMDDIVNYSKQYGFIFQGSEIYGGLSNTWDYGPLGKELKENLRRAWWKKFIQENPYNYGVDAAILMNPEVWVASGHVASFADPLMDCKHCKSRYRADKLVEDFTEGKETGDGWDNEKLEKFIKENDCSFISFNSYLFLSPIRFKIASISSVINCYLLSFKYIFFLNLDCSHGLPLTLFVSRHHENRSCEPV